MPILTDLRHLLRGEVDAAGLQFLNDYPKDSGNLEIEWGPRPDPTGNNQFTSENPEFNPNDVVYPEHKYIDSIPFNASSIPFTNSEVNRFVKGVYSKHGVMNDPTYLGFTVMFDWESPLLSGLGKESTININENFGTGPLSYPMDSAAGYLERIGEINKMTMLQSFGTRLQLLNRHMPWYWQSIDGLERAYKANQDFSDPYRGGDDAVITINTLESLDFAVRGITDLYRNAAFDFDYTREMIPDNLRKMNVYIYVHEIRSIRKPQAIAGLNNQLNMVQDFGTAGEINMSEHIPIVMFNFNGCELLPAEDSKTYSTITNAGAEMATGSFTFSYHDVTMEHRFPWLNYVIKPSSSTSDISREFRQVTTPEESKLNLIQKTTTQLSKTGQKYLQRLKRSAFSAARGATRNLVEKTKEEIKDFIFQNVEIENVYGKGNRIVDIIKTADIGGAIRAATGGGIPVSELDGASYVDINNDQNIYDGAKTESYEDIENNENVFPDASNLRDDSDYRGGNVYNGGSPNTTRR